MIHGTVLVDGQPRSFSLPSGMTMLAVVNALGARYPGKGLQRLSFTDVAVQRGATDSTATNNSEGTNRVVP